MEATTVISNKDKFIALNESKSSVLKNSWANEIEAANAAFTTFELPTTRHEEWKYTRTTRLANENWKWSESLENSGLSNTIIEDLNAARIVFINGNLSLADSSFNNAIGCTISVNENIAASDIAQINVAPSTNVFEAFQRTNTSAAISIRVEKNTAAETPLHIVHLITDNESISTPAIFIHLGTGATLEITESFHGNENTKGLTIRGLYAHVGTNARLEYNKIQAEKDEQFHISLDNVRVENDGYSNFNTLTIDGGWVRNDLRIDLNGQNIEAHLSGFYLPRNKQLVDNHTKVDHMYPHCMSNELYKGILFDQSTGVFNGKVYVRKDAQKTNAYQTNSNILASDDATMNTKPELEIYADDVKCSHGTTTGQLDEQAMFYLRARGMSPDSARKLLTTAFINDVLNKVENKIVRQHVIDALVQKGLLYI